MRTEMWMGYERGRPSAGCIEAAARGLRVGSGRSCSERPAGWSPVALPRGTHSLKSKALMSRPSIRRSFPHEGSNVGLVRGVSEE